jgi:HD-GYP domain-containing protein (c-di-GMP phosphodiesterase class II)
MEHVLRQCLIALRLAERFGLDEADRAVVYYTALLVNVGCHTDAHEQAKWFGDDIALKAVKYSHGLHGLRSAAAGIRQLGSGHPLLARFRIGMEFAVSGHRDLNDMLEHHSEMARRLGEQLGLSEPVLVALSAAYEQWDGKGWPGDLRGDGVPIAARLAQLAEFVEVAHRVGGISEARAVANKQRGSQFDPHLVELLVTDADLIFSDVDEVRTWEAVIDIEPSLAIVLTDARFDAALEAIANFIDLKSPYFLGHARAVADLATVAAERSGMSTDEVLTLRRAGFVQGFGRLGVSNSIWDKRGPLGPGEWERVRMHPYLTERMLGQSRSLAPFGAIAVQVRERLDGSGYPRGSSGTRISRQARVLAAADAYQSMLEPRPHREALSSKEAAMEVRAEVKAGRLDGDAVEAVLGAAGHRVSRRRDGPAGLTAREVEVLRLAARGLSNKDIASRLVISPKTVANHIEHIYAKIGVSSRAMAGFYAMQNGLLPEEESAPI